LATLRTSEEKFRTLFENLELGVLEVDQEDRVIYTNEAFNKMLGYTSEEIQGKNCTCLVFSKKRGSQNI